ncbi:MAG: class I SAM-dependent methyltransferase [bacterium]|nr:class I SAM-dependent methyltransferase [bacterium]MDE0238678.1 class I SAM-dependent methyltransferase [bacterium]MDE0418696.1 class I SAM-dependent methyltransferase [bacterium]
MRDSVAGCRDNLACHLADRQAEVLDWGCGDGEVGAALSGLGYRLIDGMDAASSMLARARERGVYRRLFSAESPADLPDRSYDAVVASRVFCGEDASVEVLDGLVRLLRAGGVMSLAVAPRGGLEDACERMCREGALLKMEATWDRLPATGEPELRFLVLGRF